MIRFVADAKRIQLNLVLPEKDLYINADYEKIARVVNNLIENAAQSVSEQNGIITVRIEDRNDCVGINVEDNGPGIHDDDKQSF